MEWDSFVLAILRFCLTSSALTRSKPSPAAVRAPAPAAPSFMKSRLLTWVKRPSLAQANGKRSEISPWGRLSQVGYGGPMNRFFDELGVRWAEAARSRGADIEEPVLDTETASELLELARVAAHSQERRFAPLACYMAGVAAARLRQVETEANLADYIKD